MANRKRRFHVHQLNQRREETSEYFNKFPNIKKFPDKFQQYMGMEVDTFENISVLVSPRLQKKWCNLHQQPILAEQRLVITLRFLRTGQSYSDLAVSFSIGKSTVFSIVQETMVAMWNALYQTYMPVPSKQKLKKVARDFYNKRQFPNCVGAVDTKHVKIKKPAHSKGKNFNYKKFHSIKLQAVVASDYSFLCIDVGGCGSEHDAATFAASSFYESLEVGLIQLPDPTKLPNSTVTAPHYFIGDGAYPLSSTLLKPYRGKNLPKFQKLFNKRLSYARVVVEIVFGILCKRFKIFKTMMEHTPETVCMIIKCACILHNMIIALEKHSDHDLSRADLQKAREVFFAGEEKDDISDISGKNLQHLIMKYFWKNRE